MTANRTSEPEHREVARLPRGFGVVPDVSLRRLSGGWLFGGSPARAMRLTPAGERALAELQTGLVESAAAAVLARRLTDAGMAHPVPSTDDLASGRVPLSVTVIIPVRDRTETLDRCLSAVGDDVPVIVVDDGSADAKSVAAVAERHGAVLCRHDISSGPAAARNTGLAGVTTDMIAFLDSDCVPPPGWITELAAHLADPLVGAVAPRIVARAPAADSAAAVRYAAACGSLDLGSRPARVVPGGRVSYVPTAALLVRRAALEAAARVTTGVDGAEPGGAVFDPALRFGEDVDLVWRLHRAGWRVRYDPYVLVEHDVPRTWAGMLAKRFRYGTSAAPLARRHPANMAPLVLQPWPATTAAALLARKPLPALGTAVGGWLDMTAKLRKAGVPVDGAPAATVTAITQTWLGIGRFATQFAAPLLAAALVAPGGRTAARRWGRRAAAASLLLGPAVKAYKEHSPELNPVPFMLGHIADDACYGAGVWTGCVRERTILPVRPVISWRPLRLTSGAIEEVTPDG